MKKLFSALLVLVMVCSLCVSAFATSPTAGVTSGDTTAALPETAKEGSLEDLEAEFEICDLETDEVKATIPAEDVKLTAVGDADKLDEEASAKFLEVYEDVKKIDDRIVKYFFWLEIPEEYKVEEGQYLKFVFVCKGENVQVTVDGDEMEVKPVEDKADTYLAKLTKLGAVAILCDKE